MFCNLVCFLFFCFCLFFSDGLGQLGVRKASACRGARSVVAAELSHTRLDLCKPKPKFVISDNIVVMSSHSSEPAMPIASVLSLSFVVSGGRR